MEPRGHLEQMLCFCLVGIINTMLDFVVYNLLTNKAVGWPAIYSNIISLTIGAVFSFLANCFWVFSSPQVSPLLPLLKFASVNLISLYIIQSTILVLVSRVWSVPLVVANALVRNVSFFKRWQNVVLARNIAKLLATLASLLWNFLWYKFYVFR